MNQPTEDAIAGMFNVFPQTNQDYEILLETLLKLCAGKGMKDQAIIRAANRFAAGEVPGQSDRFAPSGPEFLKEAGRQQEFLDIQARPRIAPIRAIEHTPWHVKIERKRQEYAHRPVLFDGINFDQFKKLSREKQLPVGAVWVAMLGTIYGPEQKPA